MREIDYGYWLIASIAHFWSCFPLKYIQTNELILIVLGVLLEITFNPKLSLAYPTLAMLDLTPKETTLYYLPVRHINDFKEQNRLFRI